MNGEIVTLEQAMQQTQRENRLRKKAFELRQAKEALGTYTTIMGVITTSLFSIMNATGALKLAWAYSEKSIWDSIFATPDDSIMKSIENYCRSAGVFGVAQILALCSCLLAFITLAIASLVTQKKIGKIEGELMNLLIRKADDAIQSTNQAQLQQHPLPAPVQPLPLPAPAQTLTIEDRSRNSTPRGLRFGQRTDEEIKRESKIATSLFYQNRNNNNNNRNQQVEEIDYD